MRSCYLVYHQGAELKFLNAVFFDSILAQSFVKDCGHLGDTYYILTVKVPDPCTILFKYSKIHLRKESDFCGIPGLCDITCIVP